MWFRLENSVVVEISNVDPSERFHPSLIWVESNEEVTIGQTFRDGDFIPTDVNNLDTLKSSLLSEIKSKEIAVLFSGAPFRASQHIALDDVSRVDLGAMAMTASAALSGQVDWPASYSRGWISVENTRIPLKTAKDGISLAAFAGDFYAKVKQHARDLKDKVTEANSADDISAIDIDSGW